jgi:hypothetical protein
MSNNLNATHPEPDQGKKKLTAEQVKQLIHHSSKEVTEQRLKEILEAELQKPEDEIDLQLVDDILAELNPMEMSQSEADASWERLERRIDQNGKAEKADAESARETPKHTGKPLLVFLRRAALAAAVLVLLFFISLGSARAMKWTFLLKLLNPIAQTFGISLDELTPEAPLDETYSVSVDNQEIRQFSTEDEIPEQYNGYRIKLRNLPDRFTLSDSAFIPEQATDTFNFFYQAGEEWLLYNVIIFDTEQVGIEYQFETTMEVQEKRQIGMIELTFYHNGHDKTQYVSWVDRNAHYSLYGYLSMDELTDIINGFQ